MCLFHKLPAEDVEKFSHYVELYGTRYDNTTKKFDAEKYLRRWSTAKADLYGIFGNKFILEKKISVLTPEAVLGQRIDKAFFLWNRANDRTFFGRFYDLAYNAYHKMLDDREYGISHIFHHIYNYNIHLTYNKIRLINGTSLTIPSKYLKIDKDLTIHNGEKAVKAYYKIAKALGYEDEIIPVCKKCHAYDGECDCEADIIEMNAYEAFRIQHSRILNQKKLEGTLCLSIHPLDFLTMSDNDCGWSSCMSWRNEGEFHLGTVEMMNSSNIVMAYLKSDTDMELIDAFGYNDTWNSKKWRQLIIVSPELIVGNRQYPYNSEGLSEIAISWIVELCRSIGWGSYNEKFTYAQRCRNDFSWGSIEFCIEMDSMYNDFDHHEGGLAFCSSELLKNEKSFCINVSGDALCDICYESIIDNSPEQTSCPSCLGHVQCFECGYHLHVEEANYYDGKIYCINCYERFMARCEFCGDYHPVSETYAINLRIDECLPNDPIHIIFNTIKGKGRYRCCPHCFEEHFKNNNTIIDVTSTFTRFKQICSFDLDSLDKGIIKHFIPYNPVEIMMNMNYEERCAYIQNKWCYGEYKFERHEDGSWSYVVNDDFLPF